MFFDKNCHVLFDKLGFLLEVPDILEQNFIGIPVSNCFSIKYYPQISDNIEIFLHLISTSTQPNNVLPCYHLLPGKIKIDITFKIFTSETCCYSKTVSKLNVTNIRQKGRKICGLLQKYEHFFTSGGNWYPAIIGHKTVPNRPISYVEYNT